jgi:hypothetical protein
MIPLEPVFNQVQIAIPFSCFNPDSNSVDDLLALLRIKDLGSGHRQSKLPRSEIFVINALFQRQLQKQVLTAVGLGNVGDSDEPSPLLVSVWVKLSGSSSGRTGIVGLIPTCYCFSRAWRFLAASSLSISM